VRSETLPMRRASGGKRSKRLRGEPAARNEVEEAGRKALRSALGAEAPAHASGRHRMAETTGSVRAAHRTRAEGSAGSNYQLCSIIRLSKRDVANPVPVPTSSKPRRSSTICCGSRTRDGRVERCAKLFQPPATSAGSCLFSTLGGEDGGISILGYHGASILVFTNAFKN